MKKIKLTQGKYVLVDNDDFKWLSQNKWHFDGRKYAVRSLHKEKTCKTIYMHRVIMDTPNDMFTDHINFNTLDNRRSNLRVCTKLQNNLNRKVRTDSKIGLKGVGFYGPTQKYVARIKINGKNTVLGYFNTPKEAHEAYREAAIKYHKEYAYAWPEVSCIQGSKTFFLPEVQTEPWL